MSWLDTLEKIRTRDFRKAKPEDRDTAARSSMPSSPFV